jgi:hypothetical protein
MENIYKTVSKIDKINDDIKHIKQLLKKIINESEE